MVLFIENVYGNELFSQKSILNKPYETLPFKKEIQNRKPNLYRDIPIDNVLVDIYIPNTLKSEAKNWVILVLPGWNYSKTRWQIETPILSLADKYGAVLIFPEMKTTTYESFYFLETTRKWHKLPGSIFVKNNLIPNLTANYNLLTQGAKNILVGLSTGARGVVRISVENPETFVIGAGFSGDFDQSIQPKDPLITSIYGPYKQFSKRWKFIDNPYNESSKLKIPIYLSHGMKDHIVPAIQTQKYCKKLKYDRTQTTTICKIDPNGKHDFKFWSQEIKNAFKWFNEIL